MPVQSLLRTVLFSDDLSRKLVVEQHPEDGGFGWWLYKLDRHNRSSLLLSILEFGDYETALEDGEWHLRKWDERNP
ncbi:MAG: hypothetical protein K2X38_12945 [Gemmataceae bacterium]|nr:hypothetical protein [Gemmataceae bacterium]